MTEVILGIGAVLSLLFLLIPQQSAKDRGIAWSQLWFIAALLSVLSFGLARVIGGMGGVVFASLAGSFYAALLPLQYLFVREFTRDPAVHKWPHIFAPVANLVLSVVLVLMTRVDATGGVVTTTSANPNWTSFVTLVAVTLMTAYPAAGLYRLAKKRSELARLKGRRATRHINGLMMWVASSILISIAGIATDLRELSEQGSFAFIAELTYGILAVQLIILGIYITRNVKAFEAVASNLKDNNQDVLVLEKAMLEGREYQTAGLSAERLAERLGWTVSRLNAAIRISGHRHFNEYINQWRIRFVTSRIEAGSDQSILDLAFEAGFGSKSTFNDAFRRHTGVSPSEYRKTAKPGPAEPSR